MYRICACQKESYKSVLFPDNGLVLVGIGVGEALDLTRLAAEETVQIGSDLVTLSLLEVMALCATGLQKCYYLLPNNLTPQFETSEAQRESVWEESTLKRPAPFLASPEMNVSS